MFNLGNGIKLVALFSLICVKVAWLYVRTDVLVKKMTHILIDIGVVWMDIGLV